MTTPSPTCAPRRVCAVRSVFWEVVALTVAVFAYAARTAMFVGSNPGPVELGVAYLIRSTKRTGSCGT